MKHLKKKAQLVALLTDHADVVTSNGVIQVIDTVILPQ